jgi:hypothetical protein
LLTVNGASGAGKTAVALHLISGPPSAAYIVLDQDILWMPEMAGDAGQDGKRFRNLWLRMAKSIHQGGRSVLLFGTHGPDQFDACPERRFIGEIHTLCLVCADDVLEARLARRPSWRGFDRAKIDEAVSFNRWLRDNGPRRFPGVTLLDTTEIPIATAAASVTKWAEALVSTPRLAGSYR